MWRLTISVRNKTVMTRALKTTMWSAELTTICGEFMVEDMRWLSSDLYDYCTGLCSETSTWSLVCSTG